MKSVTREEMQAKLISYKQDMIRDTGELIAYKSFTDDVETTKAALKYVIDKAASMGMRTGYTTRMDVGFAEIGEGDEVVGVLAHVDVVDTGDIDKWPYDPFELVITEDNFMHARGIVDDKGPDEFASGLVLDDGCYTYNGIYVGRTISCPTVMELTPDGVRLNINIRSRYGVDDKWLNAAFARHAEEYDYSFDFVECTNPNMVDPRLPFMQQMMEVYSSYSPEDAEFRLAGGASYAASMKNCVCFGPVFDTDPDCAHMEDERFSVDTMMRATDIYCEYLIICAEE